MKTAEQKVLKFIDEAKMISPGDKILVAFSGGPDSVFALNFLKKYQRRLKIELAAAHINHNLRKNAVKDEHFCRNFCSEMGIDLFVHSADVKEISKKLKISIEEAARGVRYDFLNKKMLEIKFDKIVTAHNKNDNLETVLLNLFKGTGIRGLSGIPVVRGKIIRPFLVLSKDEILNCMKHQNINYRIDESNLSDDYQRNFIRNRLVPEIKGCINPNVDEAVFRTSQNVSGYKDFLSEKIIKKYRKKISVESGQISIPVELYKKSGVFIISELLIESVSEKFGIELNFENLKQINGLFEKQKGKNLELAGGINVIREADEIVLYRKNTNTNPEEIIIHPGRIVKTENFEVFIEPTKKTDNIKAGKGRYEIISADNISNIFILRSWKKNDKFIPLGMKNFKKVSDFLTDIKVPSKDRKEQMVLVNDEKLVWILGYRIDDRFKVTNTTEKYYKLWLKPIRKETKY